MPRKTKSPICYLALSPAMLAAALDVPPKHIYAAIEAGHLEVRTLPGSVARRISIAEAERWYRDHWLKAAPRTKRKVPKNGL